MAWNQEARRLLATERGAVSRDWGGSLPIVLAYPNSYAVGMSSLAMHSLYRYWNDQPGVVCERAFAWLTRSSRDDGPALTFESQRPLAEAAVLAVSISFEMDAFYLIDILRRANIPLRASERDDSHPIVLLGGPGVSANPEPLALLADGILIGEAEPALDALTAALREGLPLGRDETLDRVSRLRGLYVPLRHTGEPVQRLWLADLEACATESTVVAPEAQFGDMHLVEVSRGCGRGCRFCLAGRWYLPKRERSVESILASAERGLAHHNKVGLVASAVSDHSQIEPLALRLREMGARISVSSLRIDPLSPVLVDALVDSGSRSITMAPEAGSERMRRHIHKGVTEADVLRAAELVAGRFASCKLYYMVGLPTETDEDMDAIVDLSARVKGAFQREVVVNVTPFVPKAHTAFERVGLPPKDVLEARIKRLRKACREQRLQFRDESVRMARVQTLLARGDRALGDVLLDMARPTPGRLLRAATRSGLDPAHYLGELPAERILPWAHIQAGPTREDMDAMRRARGETA